MKSGDYEIKNIYQGGYSSLDPSSSGYSNSFTGYRTNAGDVGLAIDARTANVVQEISTKLSSGTKNIELTQVFPEVFNAIPKQQFK